MCVCGVSMMGLCVRGGGGGGGGQEQHYNIIKS